MHQILWLRNKCNKLLLTWQYFQPPTGMINSHLDGLMILIPLDQFGSLSSPGFLGVLSKEQPKPGMLVTYYHKLRAASCLSTRQDSNRLGHRDPTLEVFGDEPKWMVRRPVEHLSGEVGTWNAHNNCCWNVVITLGLMLETILAPD